MVARRPAARAAAARFPLTASALGETGPPPATTKKNYPNRLPAGAGSTTKSPDGRTAGEQLAAARKRVLQLVAEHASAWADVRHALAAEGIEIVKYNAIPEHPDLLRQRFIDEIYPVLQG